ncbi:hypothetical protein SAMN06265374_1772 [Roseibium denhamense]|uniref:Uncharacterized protein n=2 Tax=Roseibium denhamense TaxID=76305 RepID=A0ABY1NTS5_9HYPH|nr:hypothetical protein SAMN06265374_1772 [Roseibium denhamense]
MSFCALALSALNTGFVVLDRQERAPAARFSFLTELNNETRRFFDSYLEYAGNKDAETDPLIHRKLANQSILITSMISRSPNMDNKVVDVCLADLRYRVATFAEFPGPIKENWEFSIAEDLDQFFNMPGELAIEYFAESDARSQKGDAYFFPDLDLDSIYAWHCVDRR